MVQITIYKKIWHAVVVIDQFCLNAEMARHVILFYKMYLIVTYTDVQYSYPTIDIIATEIAGNYLFPWKDANWLTCPIIYMEIIGENIKNIK